MELSYYPWFVLGHLVAAQVNNLWNWPRILWSARYAAPLLLDSGSVTERDWSGVLVFSPINQCQPMYLHEDAHLRVPLPTDFSSYLNISKWSIWWSLDYTRYASIGYHDNLRFCISNPVFVDYVYWGLVDDDFVRFSDWRNEFLILCG
jgi:hypothetical protein